MRTLGFQRHKYTADFYKFSRETVGDTSTVNYYFVGKIPVTFGINANNQSTVRCDEPLPIGCLLSSIKDSNNNLILDDLIWQVTNLQPVTNAFGTVESYTMKVVKYQGTL